MFKVILFILVVSLSGCEQAIDHSVIRFGLQSAPLTIDPRMATDASAERINRLVYQSLVDVDEQLNTVAGLATWQTLSPRHYRFTLKADNALFHNGETLTTQDVKACYQYILNRKNASPHLGDLSHIEKIQILNDRRIDFYLTRNDILFPARLSIGIPDKDASTVGNGFFQWVNTESMSAITLQRRADKQKLTFLHVKDPSIRVLKLLRGELDIIQNDLQPELIEFLQNKKEVLVQSRLGSTFSYIGFNMNDPITSKKTIRQAISLAVDRQKLINSLLGGRARLSHSLLPLQHWARKTKMLGFSYQPDQARQLLKQAGYDNKHRPHIIYKTTTDPLRLRIATVIQKQLADVGIDLEIRSYDWGTFYGDIKSGNFQMYSLSWVGINSPDIYQTVFHSQSVPPKGANRGRYNNPQVDKLLDTVFLASTVTPTLPQIIDIIQRILLDDLPYIPLWFEDNIAVTSKRIKYYSLSLNGNYDALKKVRLVNPLNEVEP